MSPRLVAAALLCGGVAWSRGAAAEGEALTVQVHGERGPPAGKRDPSGASTVIKDERLRAPGASAADVLAEVPGVQVSRAGAGSDLATASIRGATSAQTPVYLAGVRLNDDTTGTADLSLVPLWMIRRVEVYRSGAPFEADRLGPGGAVFFEPVLPRGSRVGAGIGAGSFGELSTWVAGMIGDERAGAIAAVRRQSATNDYLFRDDRGTFFDPSDDVERRRVNADFTAYDLFSVGRARVGRGSITAVFNALTREQGVTGLSVIPAESARARARRFLGAVTAAVPCGEGDRCRIEVGTSALLSGNEISDPRRELGLSDAFVSSAAARLVETARLRYRFGDALAIFASAAQEMEQLRLDAPASSLLRARRATSRAAAGLVADVGRSLQLNVLATLEHHTTGAAGQDGDGSTTVFEPAARAGARLRLAEGFELLANLGRYVRVPTLGELYGTTSVVRGNADLVPERGYMADAGARAVIALRNVEIYADVFVFARFASNLIGYRQSSLNIIRPYNIGSARVLGLEVATGMTLFRHVRADLALTMTDPRDTSPNRLPDNFLPLQARLVVAPALELRSGPLPVIALDRAALRARFTYRAAYAAKPGGNVIIRGQAPLDLEASLWFWKERVAARLAVTDVFDADRFDIVGFPLPRRGGHGSLEVWW